MEGNGKRKRPELTVIYNYPLIRSDAERQLHLDILELMDRRGLHGTSPESGFLDSGLFEFFGNDVVAIAQHYNRAVLPPAQRLKIPKILLQDNAILPQPAQGEPSL